MPSAAWERMLHHDSNASVAGVAWGFEHHVGVRGDVMRGEVVSSASYFEEFSILSDGSFAFE
jgi:hypothetical protein